MHRLFVFLMTVIFSWCLLAAACTEDKAKTAGYVTNTIIMEPVPEEADSAHVDFRDLNHYTEGNLFCVASIVDNQSLLWQRVWVRLELFDAADKPLTIDGDSSMVFRLACNAIPPKGASAFFISLPFSRISGTPAYCRLSGAAAIEQEPGAILIALDVGGVRALRPDPTDSTKTVDVGYQAQATIDNPLAVVAQRPRILFLLYGKDKKLYFVQMLDPQDPASGMHLEPVGAIGPQSRANMVCPVSYQALPQTLRDVHIERIDIQAYDARDGK